MTHNELINLSEEVIKHNYNLRLASAVITDLNVAYLDPNTGEYFEFDLPNYSTAKSLFLFFADNMDAMLHIGVSKIDVEYIPAEWYPEENQWEPGHVLFVMELLNNTYRSVCYDDLTLPVFSFDICECIELPEDISDDDMPF